MRHLPQFLPFPQTTTDPSTDILTIIFAHLSSFILHRCIIVVLLAEERKTIISTDNLHTTPPLTLKRSDFYVKFSFHLCLFRRLCVCNVYLCMCLCVCVCVLSLTVRRRTYVHLWSRFTCFAIAIEQHIKTHTHACIHIHTHPHTFM